MNRKRPGVRSRGVPPLAEIGEEVSVPAVAPGVPMAEEQFGENLRFDFALFRFFQPPRIAGLIGAVGIDLRGEEQHVAHAPPM